MSKRTRETLLRIFAAKMEPSSQISFYCCYTGITHYYHIVSEEICRVYSHWRVLFPMYHISHYLFTDFSRMMRNMIPRLQLFYSHVRLYSRTEVKVQLIAFIMLLIGLSKKKTLFCFKKVL